MDRWIEDVDLKGQCVSLTPLARSHRSELIEAASDGKLWELWYTSVPSPEAIDDYLQQALDQRKSGTALPFVVTENASGKIIGMTRYCNIKPENRRLEIGFTWYAKRFQRTCVNPECKLLLLTHAFEQLSAIAVEFRTHWYNFASRRAIAGLGAKQDGVLRNHKLDSDGNIRDTVVFSIIAGEWPTVKKSLQYRLKKE